MIPPTPRLPLIAACAGLLLASGPSMAGTPCVEAVFFDLGDTLVENDGSGTFVLRTGAEETVADLQSRGVRLGIITNVPGSWDIDDLRAILAEPEFLDEFEVVILSSEAPAPKPNPVIYTFAYEALAEPRPAITSTAFVGETLSEIANAEVDPTQGARAVGMIGIHLSDLPPSSLTDYTIPTEGLEEVVTIVDDTCGSASTDDTTPGLDSTPEMRVVPNPADGGTRIGFSLSRTEHVELTIFDAGGRVVTQLWNGIADPGRYEVAWSGADTDSKAVPAGIYYSRLAIGSQVEQTKIVRLR